MPRSGCTSTTRAADGAFARYYDPALGRFISADTIVPAPGNPQSLNRYAYVLNNPLRYTDPTGHYSCGDYYDPACFESFEERKPYVEMTGDEGIWGYRYVRRHDNRPVKKLTTIGIEYSAGGDINTGVGFGGSASTTYAFNFHSGELGVINGIEAHTVQGIPSTGASAEVGVFLGYNGEELGDFAGPDYVTEWEAGIGSVGISNSSSYSIDTDGDSVTQYQANSFGGVIQSETIGLQVDASVGLFPFSYQRNVSPGSNNASATGLVLYPWNWGRLGFITQTPMTSREKR